MSADPRYHRIIELRDDRGQKTGTAILAARVGRGMFIYTALDLDGQLATAANAGAARLIVNLMARR